MQKIHPPGISGGSWINSDGTPNSRAVAHLVIGVMTQLNSLADDIEWIKARLPAQPTPVSPKVTSVLNTIKTLHVPLK